MTAYATRSDLYKYGLPRGTLGMPARLAASSTASTDAFELDGHGLETNDAVIFRAAEGGSLAPPLVAGTTYYAIRISDSVFKVAATANGAVINLTSDGGETWVAIPLPIDDVLEYYSRFVDDYVPAHAAPLDSPYPVIIVGTVAELAAKKLMSLAGHKAVSVDETEKAAHERLKRWAAGLPTRAIDAAAQRTNLAVVSTLGASTSDERGWGSESLP